MQESLGEYLKLWRLQKGLSLEGMALRTRIPLPYLLALEQDDFSTLPPFQLEESLGDYLKRWRLQKGISLEAIANTTRIPLRHLEALEGNEFWKLPPAAIIAKAYVKTYCRCLALQEAEEAQAMIRFAALAEAVYGEVVAETPNESATEPPWLPSFYVRFAQKAGVISEGLLSRLVSVTLEEKVRVVDVTRRLIQLSARIAARLGSRFARTVTTGSRWLICSIVRTADQAKQGFQKSHGHVAQWTSAVTFRLVSDLGRAATEGREWLDEGRRSLAQWAGACRNSGAVGIVKAAEKGKAYWMDVTSVLIWSGRAIHGHLGSGIAKLGATGKGWLQKGHTRAVQGVDAVWSLLAAVLITASQRKPWLDQAFLPLAQAVDGFCDRIGAGVAWIFPDDRSHLFTDRWHQLVFSARGPAPRVQSTQRQTTDGLVVEKNTSPFMDTNPRQDANVHRIVGLIHEGLAAERPWENPPDRFSRERCWMKSRGLVVQYGIAMLLALALTAILGNLQLFMEVSIGATKLTASRVVQFMGYGGALFMFWLLGKRLSLELAQGGRWHSHLPHLITPVLTLIVLSAGYNIVLLLGAPFLGATGKAVYDWIFVMFTLSAAVWLLSVWFQRATPLLDSLEPLWRAARSTTPQTTMACPQCRGPVARGLTYCGHCGERVT